MATDVEESDMDDHDRPTPPKRQCTRLVKVNETRWDTEKHSSEKEETIEELENTEYDDAERHAREKLKEWQACQEARGFIDNTINKILDSRFMRAMSLYLLGEPRFNLFSDSDIEDTAVIMAIRNHGLVQSTELDSESHAFYSDKAPGYWTNNEYKDVHCSCRPSGMQGIGNFSSSLATTSTNSLRLSSSEDMKQYNSLDWDADRVDDSYQQEDFLERAVAEAIKKKGLSALSVDHG